MQYGRDDWNLYHLECQPMKRSRNTGHRGFQYGGHRFFETVLAITGKQALLCVGVMSFFYLGGCGDDGKAGDGQDAVAVDGALDVGFPDAHSSPDGSEPDATEMPDGGMQPDDPPDESGPFGLDSVEDTLSRDGRQIPVKVYIPQRSGEVRSPLVVFVPGFQVESARYDALAQRVASHGFVFVLCDPPDPMIGVNHVAMAQDLSAVLDWVLDSAGDVSAYVDETKVGGIGHSLGGKVTAMWLHRDDRVTALFGIDPVNEGNGPLGYDDDHPDILPDELQDEIVPMGFAGETVNATAGGFNQACAPEGKNFIVFYESAEAASWRAMWDFLGADHMDFVDDTSGCSVCSMCQEGTADPDVVSASLHTLVVAFFRRHLNGENAMDAWLVGASVPAEIDVTFVP
jgi:pimeloyl-ACP methyl ester carboxylesterase